MSLNTWLRGNSPGAGGLRDTEFSCAGTPLGGFGLGRSLPDVGRLQSGNPRQGDSDIVQPSPFAGEIDQGA